MVFNDFLKKKICQSVTLASDNLDGHAVTVTQPTSNLDLDQMLCHWATRHLWELHCKATILGFMGQTCCILLRLKCRFVLTVQR